MSDVELIKQKLNIVDVAGSYVKLERNGSNYRARCPFHSEKTPSFFVSPDRGTYYCFGCGAKGDIFSLVEQLDALDFRGALQSLATRAGIILSSYKPDDKKKKDIRDELYRVLERATAYFENELHHNDEAKQYLFHRGLEEKTIRNFRIGYAPLAWRSLYELLLQEGYTQEILLEAGLIKQSENSFYDRFRGRIMFPITDVQGRVIGFSGRILNDDSLNAKYLNSPETLLFKKSEVLYGIDKAKQAIRQTGYSVLVEGQLDLILSHQIGITQTVASSGTAVSDLTDSGGNKALLQLYRLAPRIVLGFDGDKAGISAMYRTGAIALKAGFDTKVVVLPPDEDPADIIQNAPDKWKNSLKNTERLITFFAKRANTETKTSLERSRYISERVVPLIAQVSNALEQDEYIKEIALITEVNEDALRKVLAAFLTNHKITTHVVLDSPSYVPPTLSQGEALLASISLIPEESSQIIWHERIQEILGRERFQNLLDLYTEQKDELLFRIEKIQEHNKDLEGYHELLFKELHASVLKEDMGNILKEIKVREQSGLSVQDLMIAFQEKKKLLETLS